MSQNQSLLVVGGLGNPTNLTHGTGDSFGWNGGWSATAGTNQYMKTSLTYTNGSTLFVDGGAARIGGLHPMTGSTTAQQQRQLGMIGNGGTTNTLGYIAADHGGVLWMSFLYKNLVNDPLQWGGVTGTNGYAAAWLGFYSGNTLSAAGAANVNGSSLVAIGGGNTPTINVGQGLQIGDLNGNNNMLAIDNTAQTTWGPNDLADFIVLKLTVDNTAAADRVDVWLNPDLSVALGASTVYYMTNISSANAFRLQAGNQNAARTNAVFIVDEIRLGSDYVDVAPVPEPSTIAILGVTLSGLWLSIRRKRQF